MTLLMEQNLVHTGNTLVRLSFGQVVKQQNNSGKNTLPSPPPFDRLLQKNYKNLKRCVFMGQTIVPSVLKRRIEIETWHNRTIPCVSLVQPHHNVDSLT